MDSRLRLFGSLALLGTDRRSPSFPESEFPAGSLIRELADAGGALPESSARTLLRSSGVLFVCDRAGWLPLASDDEASVPERSPEEHRAMLPEGLPVTDAYGEIFRSGQLRLQWEALSYLKEKDMVLPCSLLVPALVMGRGAPALRPLLFRTVGERGLWLAALNPDWRMFAASSGTEPDMDAWDHGRPMQRQAFLAAMRAKDPTRARELFEKDMAGMDASERNTLLGLFVHGLGMDDEDMLERLLAGDRSREVRKTAASLLSRLPGSRYVARMGERLSSCMEAFLSAPAPSGLSGLLRAAAAVVGRADKTEFITPPENYDKAWAGDLISEKSPFSQFGQRAGWLYQMAVAVPLSWWTERTGKTPEELLALSERSEWKKPLQTAWGDAQLRCRDADWARAMLDVMKRGGEWPSSSGGRLDVFQLAGMLEGEEREKAWESVLSADSLSAFLMDIRTRQELDYRMSPALAEKAVAALKARLTSAAGRRDYLLSSVVDELAMVLPAGYLEDVQQMLSSLSDNPLSGAVSDRFSAVALQRRTLCAYFS